MKGLVSGHTAAVSIQAGNLQQTSIEGGLNP